jgi:hypothetical protein
VLYLRPGPVNPTPVDLAEFDVLVTSSSKVEET